MDTKIGIQVIRDVGSVPEGVAAAIQGQAPAAVGAPDATMGRPDASSPARPSASALATGIGSSSSQEPWTSHQPNPNAKAYAAKAIYGKSAIVIENISHDKQIKRPELPNIVQNNNAHQKNSIANGMRGMKQMLTVTTTGDGPEGKKADGFLYKYDKGGRIFIVCFCHSVFLSPTDFVKHANHTNWSNPMKHIVVSSPLPPPL
ncbi:ninja-family protein 2-like [Syzygium oleosum]|uniref:ninja-family protein 2-like n=1 Tax=Syzygium oleosum TaxID=219896 RepID=UPI0024B9DC98|nr:ninja-family protein 2-like [Syzygium oleosum]